jgi:hypothetical protein
MNLWNKRNIIAGISSNIIFLIIFSVCVGQVHCETKSYNIGTFLLEIKNDTIGTGSDTKYTVSLLKMGVQSKNVYTNKSIWSTSFSNDNSFLCVGNGVFTTTESSGNFNVTDFPDIKSHGQTLTKVEKVNRKCETNESGTCATVVLHGNLLVSATNSNTVIASYTVAFQQAIGQYNDISRASDSYPYVNMQVNINLAPNANTLMPSPNRLYISYACDWLENFYGMGEQYTVHGMRGRTVPVFSTEQGIGRGLQPISKLIDLTSPSHEASGNWHTTYTAIPHYVTSNLKSVYVNDTRYMTFDFGNTNGNKVTIMVITNVTSSTSPGNKNPFQLNLNILYGNDVKSLVQAHTSYVGRMTTLPEFVNKGGAVVGWEGGTNEVTSLLKVLKQFNVSIAAFWLQDWSGLRIDAFGKRLWWNWELDEDWYPDWPELASNLTKDNIRLTTVSFSCFSFERLFSCFVT